MASCRAFAISSIAVSIALASFGCKHNESGTGNGGVDAGSGTPATCEGLQCAIVDCAAMGKLPTRITGTVFAPNGTLPLYGVNVYIPLSDPGPLTEGVTCGNCASGFQGGALATAVTDEAGRFTLPDAPATGNVPLVIQVGKWRRQLVIPQVAACEETALTPVETTLPKTKAEGDIPRIAITTGNADALECLVRKLGISDTEFTTDAGAGRVHMYSGNGANKFAPGFPGGSGDFANATTLWSTKEKLSQYDITILSCEGNQNAGTKPQTSMNALRDYANLGGRIFMSHWHNIWIGGNQSDANHGIPEWKSIGTWNFGASQTPDTAFATIDQTVAKGVPFATWMRNVGALNPTGQIPIKDARYTLTSNDSTKSDRRVYLDTSIPGNAYPSVQDLQFTTPTTVLPDQRCGKVVFSDMHVSSGSRSQPAEPFPSQCNNGDLTEQEKALAFILFDISSCVGVLQ